MARIQVHPETHSTDAPCVGSDGKVYQRHQVEVTIDGDRRWVGASAISNDNFIIFGLAVRFQTGTKVWPGSATYWTKTGVVNHIRPNIDKNGHFQLVGFAEDYLDKPVRSRHNAVA